MRDGPSDMLIELIDVKRGTAHSSLPNIGAKPLICVPRAARTCCEVSDTKSSILVMISLSKVSRSSNLQKPAQSQHDEH